MAALYIHTVSTLRVTTAAGESGPLITMPGEADLTNAAQFREVITGQLAGSAHELRNRLVISPTAAAVPGCSSSRHHTSRTGTGGASRSGR